AFLTIVDESKRDSPDNYSPKTVNKIVEKSNEDKRLDGVDDNFKPNVVVILAEALWDPLLLENVEFKEDPIPYIRSLKENYTSGTLLAHVYGGGTINTELEILTGLTTRFLPEGQGTYQHLITKPIDSLAYVFREQGYNASAVHTFTNWFYKRDEMYKWL